MRSALAFCAGPAALAGYVPAPYEPRLPPAAAWMVRARRALGAGQAPDALRAFDGVLAHEPRLALAHLGRAVCLAQMEREEEARDALGATLEAARGQEEVLYQLARMCAREGQAILAIPLLAEAVRARPALAAVVAADPLFADHPAAMGALGRL